MYTSLSYWEITVSLVREWGIIISPSHCKDKRQATTTFMHSSFAFLHSTKIAMHDILLLHHHQGITKPVADM